LTRSSPTRAQWILLVCLFVASLPAVTPRIYSSDEVQYFAYLRSLWFDRDLSFENEYRYFYDRGVARSDGFRETFLELQTDTGRRINFGTIGCAILWAPFYAAGDVAARLSGAPRDGFSRPYLASVAYGSAFYGFLALVLAIRCAGRLGSNGFTGALAVWLGTPLLFYMYLAPGFSHACSAFSVALFTLVWLRVRTDWAPRGMAALGAAAALMLMVREQDVFFGVAVAADYAWSLVRRARSEGRGARFGVRGVFAAAVCFTVVYLPQLVCYRVINGHFGPHASVANKMHWWAPHALQVMFNPEHGFFVWTPLALIAIAGLLVPARGTEPRQVIGCLLLMFAFQIYVGGSVESWTLAGGFAQRRLIALTTVLVIGFARLQAAAESARPARLALGVVTAFAVYWNIAVTTEFATKMMDRQKLELRRNAYDAFVTLPRLAPSLAYRYLFDRSSFYEPAR
jgi:hypothetical protein